MPSMASSVMCEQFVRSSIRRCSKGRLSRKDGSSWESLTAEDWGNGLFGGCVEREGSYARGGAGKAESVSSTQCDRRISRI